MSDEERAGARPTIQVRVIGSDRSSEGGKVEIDARGAGGPILNLPTETMLLFRLTGRTAGWKAAFTLLCLGAAIQKTADVQDASPRSETTELTSEDTDLLAEIFRYLRDVALQLDRDGILEMTYELLREGKISRGNAAVLASDFLGKKINADAWRKAVDKWAGDNHKPAIDLPRGRPGKGKPENSV